jgi:3-hydroxy-9,10-secoandrosta-1,3,5(10)-triene-9,17-dione monooxygenase
MTAKNTGPLTSKAREMFDFVSARAEQTERDRKVPDDVVAEMKRAGMFRAFQSRRFGGLESHPADFFGAIIELAVACPSTGWILGIMGIHQFELANLPLELQEDVLGEDPDTLISSSYAPQGKVTRVEGGFTLNGQWKSSSGVDHATWVVLGGVEPPAEPDSKPTPRIFYVPLSQATVLDDWYVMGLGGTGSKSVVLKDAFVPDHRSSVRGGFQGRDESAPRLNDAPLYRLPQGLMYLLPGAAPAVGSAKGAYQVYVQQLLKRRPRMDGKAASEDPFVQIRLARAKLLIETAETRMMSSIDAMMETIACGKDLDPGDFARYMWDFSRPGEECVEAVRLLFETMGASAVYSSNPLQRFYRDILTMRQHGTQDPARGALAVARAELGLTP